MSLTDDIRRATTQKGVKIQGHEEDKFDRLLNNAFYLEKDIEGETAFLRMVMTRGAETQERVGLHASNMLKGDAEFCMRFQTLSLLYHQTQGEEVSPSLKRIFEEGNAIHEKWQRLFIRAGWSRPDELDKTLYDERYMMQYTPDIICRIPEFHNGEDMVGEIKSVNTFQFKKMVRHPSAWKQCQWYMHLTGIKHGFVLSEDKNTQDFKVELYDYDPKLVEPWVDRAEAIVTSYYRAINDRKMVKRPKWATSSDCKKCSSCSLRDACWRINGGGRRLS